jgi:hypothetical protein
VRESRAYHTFGLSDPEGFAAMGIVEALVHTHDLAERLGLAWNPPADLPGYPRLTTWRWYGTLESER